MDAMEDGLVVFDEDGRFLTANAGYKAMFFDPGEEPQEGDSALRVARRIVASRRVLALNQMDPDQAALNCMIDCYSFVRGAEFSLVDGRIIQVTSSPTDLGGILMTFRDTGRDRLGERRAAELLSEGLGSVDMGMVLWDAGLKVQMCNEAWGKLIRPLKVGDDVRDVARGILGRAVISPPQGVTEDAFVAEWIAEIHSQSVQFQIETRAGHKILISTFRMQSGGILATAIDVSAQRDAEEMARTLLRDAVEALAIGVMHFDADLRLLMYNRASKDILFRALPPPDTGSNLHDILESLVDAGQLLPSDGQTKTSVLQRFIEQATSFQQGFRPEWSDGRTLEISTYPTDLGGFLVSVQDLTERVNAERATREANELVRTIVNASPTTFLVSKVETGEIVYSTSSSRERFGEIESTLSFFLDPQDRVDYLAALLPTGSLTDYPVRFRRADGSVMNGLTSARVITYQGEQMIVSSTRDITESLAMQRELETQRQIAHQNEKLSALGELLAGVAHELSNPLSVVVGYSLMLRDQVQDETLLRRVEHIANSADRCAKIVKMFLAMARQHPTHVAACDLRDIVETSLGISTGALRSHGARIILDFEDGQSLVNGDADQLSQVYTNLITNAGHALAGKAGAGILRITCRSSPHGDKVILDVCDNGPGVPFEIRQRIFEPFFTTRETGVGTGVGLAFCHRIITAHDGTLTLHDAPGGGAIFRITLPSVSAHEVSQDILVDPAPPEGRNRRILVLDDEEVLGQMLNSILSEAGYRVEVFTKAEDAVRRCAETTFDIILSDIRMPGMDGQAFQRALGTVAPQQADRLIFLTGDALNPGLVRFLESCGRPYLEKPVAPETLLNAVDQIIGGGPR